MFQYLPGCLELVISVSEPRHGCCSQFQNSPRPATNMASMRNEILISARETKQTASACNDLT